MNNLLTLTLVALIILLIIVTYYVVRHHQKVLAIIGIVSWFSLSFYFVVEYIVIRNTAVPYDFLTQPMSDLGVTTCGMDTYPLALFEICSPYYELMNWTFILTGIVIIIGSLYLHHLWPNQWKTKLATSLFVVYGLSYLQSGIYTADQHFLVHTLGSLPGMFVHIPALLLIASSIRKINPILAKWTYISTLISTCSLLLLFLQPLFNDLPGGLLQRILYGSVYLWMIGTAVSFFRMKQKVFFQFSKSKK